MLSFITYIVPTKTFEAPPKKAKAIGSSAIGPKNFMFQNPPKTALGKTAVYHGYLGSAICHSI